MLNETTLIVGAEILFGVICNFITCAYCYGKLTQSVADEKEARLELAKRVERCENRTFAQ